MTYFQNVVLTNLNVPMELPASMITGDVMTGWIVRMAQTKRAAVGLFQPLTLILLNKF